MSLGADLKRLGGQTLVYGLGTVLVRALAFAMLPVFTRHLTREDYGVIALATSVSSALSILFPLGLHTAINRLYTDAKDEPARRDVLGTLFLGSLISGAVLAVAFDRLGGLASGLLPRSVPFDPYLRLSVWIGLATVLPYVPALFLQMRERPGTYVLLTATPALLSVAGALYEVVVLRRGAEGYLRGTLGGAAVGLLPAAWVFAREGRFRVRFDLLRRALGYGLPLVVHQGAGWILALSDRVILERAVPLDQVGLYGVGFQIASVVTVAGYALNSAWNPFVFRSDAAEGEAARPRLARLATYFVAVTAAVALAVALGAGDLLRLLSAPAYREAEGVVPWLAGGLFLGAIYAIPVSFLFLRSKTTWIPILTIAAGLGSAGLNVVLAPRHGIVAAGWASLAANALLLLLVWRTAQSVYRLPYEYGRILRVFAVAAAVYAASRLIPAEPWLPTLAARAAVWAAFPLVLAVTGFFTAGERRVIAERLFGAGRTS